MAQESLLSVPSSAFAFVLCPFLGSKELLALRATCKRCHVLLHKEQDSEELWQLALKRDFGIQSDFCTTLKIAAPSRSSLSIFGIHPSQDDVIQVTKTAFESWRHWLKVAIRFEGDTFSGDQPSILASQFLRAARLWHRALKWCQDGAQSKQIGKQIEQSLRPGIQRSSWPQEHCQSHGLWAVQAIYAFCGGQHEAMAIEDAFRGLLGGYHAYNYYSCTHLSHPFKASNENKVIGIAKCKLSSIRGVQKRIEVGIEDGLVYLNYDGSHNPMMHVSKERIGDNFDGALVWMEEYVDRLCSHFYRVGEMEVDFGGVSPEMIHLYPQPTDRSLSSSAEESRIVSRCVTRGVEIVASSIYAPQCDPGFGFVYSIRMRLLTPEDGDEYMSPEERGFESCQLQSRHWHIFDTNANSGDRVNGEGVIGMFPKLVEGGYYIRSERKYGAFEYQSCSGTVDGYFEGHLHFIPGDLRNPTGEGFDVTLGRFTLSTRPEFLY